MTVDSVEAGRSRSIIGRIHRGRDLHEALAELVELHRLETAWISAIGAFEWVTLTEYDQDARVYVAEHRVEGCELLALQGNLSERDGEPFWHLHATVSLLGPARAVLAGHLVRASVFAMEFRIEAFDGVTLSRGHDAATGLSLWQLDAGAHATAPSVRRTESDPTDRAVTWAMAAEASAESVRPAPVEHQLVKGDWLEHPKFGVCKVEGLSGDGVAILKLPDSRRKKVQIGIFDVFAPREDGARRIYPIHKKR